MTPEQKLYEQIEDFLEGNLSDIERVQFEALIAQDARMQQDVEDIKTAHFLLRAAANEELKKVLQTYSKELEENSVPLHSIHSFNWTWAIAASVILAIGIGWWVLRPQPNEPGKLFKEFYVAYPNVLTPVKMGKTEETQLASTKKSALTAYDRGDYASAVQQMEVLVKQDNDPWLLFYLGNSYLSIDKGSEAIAVFSSLQKKALVDVGLVDQVNWYLALGFIQMGETEKAINILEVLRKSDSHYQKKANTLLDKLE